MQNCLAHSYKVKHTPIRDLAIPHPGLTQQTREHLWAKPCAGRRVAAVRTAALPDTAPTSSGCEPRDRSACSYMRIPPSDAEELTDILAKTRMGYKASKMIRSRVGCGNRTEKSPPADSSYTKFWSRKSQDTEIEVREGCFLGEAVDKLGEPPGVCTVRWRQRLHRHSRLSTDTHSGCACSVLCK